jgi:hypothetical protein
MHITRADKQPSDGMFFEPLLYKKTMPCRKQHGT